jgi:plastocyanin
MRLALSLIVAAWLAAPAAPAVQVTISNFTFAPATVEVAAGTRLTWKNADDTPHVVVGADGGSPIHSPALDTDDEYGVILAAPGTYKYFCSLHPHMPGTVIVR